MKKIISGILSMAFLLAACGKTAPITSSPAPTLTPVPPTTAAQLSITQTSTPAAAVTQAPTSLPPTNSPGCTDSAAFVADVSVPDATAFNPGDTFTKTWRIQNTGTCTCNSQHLLTYFSGTQMGAPDTTPLSTTKPGDTLDISVKMTAPSDTKTYRANFEIHNPSNVKMMIDQNTKVWVIIVVNKATASSSRGSGTGSGASDSVSWSSSSSGSSGAGLLTSTCAFKTDTSRVNDVITAINAYRSKNGIPAYTVNPQLTTAAQSHSEDMACNNLFVHTGSDGSTPIMRVAAVGFSASSVTENVYGSFPPLTGQGAVS